MTGPISKQEGTIDDGRASEGMGQPKGTTAGVTPVTSDAPLTSNLRTTLEQVLAKFKEADEERYLNQMEWRAESQKWKAQGDMYGYNFHQGMDAGACWVALYFFRVQRELETLLKGLTDETKKERQLSATERLHNICDALSEQADESPFSREEWERVDRDTAEKNSRIEHLEFVLRGFYWDQVDYLKRNHLGGMNNHWMRAARIALGIKPDDAPPSVVETPEDEIVLRYGNCTKCGKGWRLRGDRSLTVSVLAVHCSCGHINK